MNRAFVAAVSALAVSFCLLSGCVPVLIAGAAGGAAMVATDRRSAGAQVDDESIELKITTQAGSEFGERIHLNVTSYNGIVLLTGEVPDQAALASVGNLAKNTEKVRVVHNEMVVGPNSDFSARSNDTYITSKVKTRMLEANKFPPNVVKVVTERSVVYLMGIVSKEEGDAAAEIAATTAGVARVVKFFQYPGFVTSSSPPAMSDAAGLPAPRDPGKIAAKIASAGEALARIAQLPRPLVFTNGVFDILHRGHVTYLEQARGLGASLVVAVNSDASVKRLGKGDERPLNPLDDRMAVLAALAAVDLVVPFDGDTPRELIVAAMPDILVKGGDYTAQTTAGAAEVVAHGGRFVAIPFAFERSTTALVRRLRR